MKKLLTLLCFSNLFSSTAQTNLQYISSTTGAASYAITYYNGFIYTGAGNTLIVYNVTGNPPYQNLWERRLGSNITTLKTRNNKLYVAANHAGISVWDVSSPANPQFMYEFEPDSLNEAAYDFAFKGSDSLFVTLKKKMALFVDNGGSLQLLQRFAYQPDSTITRGCDVKGDNLAFTSAYGNDANTGIHIYDANNLSPKSFYHQGYADPEDVLFGQNTSLLNVLGGTQSWVNADPHGLFYSLNVQDPFSPQLVYMDTLAGTPYFSIAQPIRAQNVNDTIYVATIAASQYDNQIPPYGYIYIYDCHDPANIDTITTINQGLWHFDLAVANKKIYVASEWYGVVTIDINNLFSPVNLGGTLTGGWNTSSDKYGNKLVVANEGYGFKLFDITDIHNPVLVDTNQHPGFNYGISFSKNGDYIFGYYYTNDDFRVYDANNLNLVGTMNVNGGLTTTDWYDAQIWQDYAVAIESPSFSFRKIFVADVSNPFIPVIDTQFTTAFVNDIHVNPNGKLFIANNGSLQVYNLTTKNMDVNLGAFGQNFKCIAYYNDTLYAYVVQGVNHQLRKYFYNGSNMLTLVNNVPAPIPDAKFMAADAFGLYLDYQQQGLYAYDKSTLVQTGYYKHSLEFYRPDNWGQQMMLCKDSIILISEYMGQASLLTNYDDYFTSVTEQQNQSLDRLIVYPNPANKTLVCGLPFNIYEKNTLKIFDVNGTLYKIIRMNYLYEKIDVSEWAKGIYLFEVTIRQKTYSAKVEVQ